MERIAVPELDCWEWPLKDPTTTRGWVLTYALKDIFTMGDTLRAVAPAAGNPSFFARSKIARELSSSVICDRAI
jgi:hypothetical protein